MSTAAQMRDYKGGAFFSFGFRPFFLGGAIVAAATPIVTALSLSDLVPFDHRLGAIGWHSHEMVYGYLSAVVAGFMLTAVPNWTGRLPVMGLRLQGLAALWLAGRVMMLTAPTNLFGAVVDVAFLAVMDAFMWREVIAGKNWRNAPVCLLIGLFAVGNALWHFGTFSGDGGFGLRWGVAVISILLALIGGRVTPSFTRNWLAKTGRPVIDLSFTALDKSAVAVLVAAMCLWLFMPDGILTGLVMATAALLHLMRLMRWRGWRTSAEPLVMILHCGYLWLCVSLLSFAVSVFSPALMAQTTAIHTLTAGAAGVMTLGVMTRATLGHTGRALTADNLTVLIFALVNIGAAMRLAAPYFPENYMTMITAAGVLWGLAFALFAVCYGRYLVAPRLA